MYLFKISERVSCTTNSLLEGTAVPFRTRYSRGGSGGVSVSHQRCSVTQSAVWTKSYLVKRWCIPSGRVFSSTMWLLVNKFGGNPREPRNTSTSQRGCRVCQMSH